MKNQKAITLIALVISIVVLIILAGVAINLSLGDNGIFKRATQGRENYMLAANEEQAMLANIDIDSITGGTSTPPGENPPDISGPLSSTNLAKVKEKYLGTNLVEVDYTPQTVSTTVTVDSASNNNQTAQNFTQSSVGATGTNKVKWYVLNADENNLTLVSSVTPQSVTFSGVGGYNNCLYHLNEITTNLFYNESLGVTKDRVHAIRLTDIRDAAVAKNGSSYSWDNDFVKESSNGTTAFALTQYSPSYRQYPSIYGTSTGTVNTNNTLYDETPGNKITNNVFTTASTLNVKYTEFGGDNNAYTLSYLGAFGTSGIGKDLFNASGANYWLASRCVHANSSYARFCLRRVHTGYLYNYTLCTSDRDICTYTYPLRVVVSVPSSRVNVDANGSITIQ